MLAMTTAEINLQRRVTARYINANPTDIILKSRGQAVFDKGTKKFGQPVARQLQRFRIIWLEETGISERPPDGTRKFDFALVGNHDAEVAIGDFWTRDKQEYRIESISPSNGWEVKAYGVSHGSKPT